MTSGNVFTPITSLNMWQQRVITYYILIEHTASSKKNLLGKQFKFKTNETCRAYIYI
jgi:hypothetical protein